MNSSNRDPCALDMRSFCKSGLPLRGSLAIGDMPRLLPSLAAATDAQVDWLAEGSLQYAAGASAQRWLHLQAKAKLPLQCQRCLAVMLQPVEVNRRFRFVAGEEQAALEDEHSEEEVLELQPRLDLHALLEDELILALPIVPRHAEACPEPLAAAMDPLAADGQTGAGPVAIEPDRPHPFAALAGLRGQLRKKD